jgi:pantoate--beta-alanine ligase
VNPKQFGPNEDFHRYPRPFSDDLALLEANNASAVYAPSISEMYPEHFCTQISVQKLGEVLCGSHRPGHFDGVCTVVMLLLNLAQANKAYFGLKDFQQFFILKRMCTDLAHPTELVPVPTVREADGLAMSSRNKYLDAAGRQTAKAVPQALAAAARAFLEGQRNAAKLISTAESVLKKANLAPQYLEIRDLEALKTLSGDLPSDAVLAIAQPVPTPNGSCRLIDNVVLSANPFYRDILDDLLGRTQ